MSANSSKNSKAAALGSAAAASALPHSPDDGAPVNIPLIKTKEINKKLPTYASVLQHSKDTVSAEDLDAVQLELETLLSSAALRYRVLRSEVDSLDKDEKRNERKAKHNAAVNEKPSIPTATHSGAVAGTSSGLSGGSSSSNANGKRKREETSSSSGVRKPKNLSASTSMKHKHKSNNFTLHTDDSMEYTPATGQVHHHHVRGENHHHHLQKVTLPKNDTPNKFWLSVEPYCMPLTNEDLRLLDDLMDQYNGPLVPPIPDLGPHYSTTWATEDLKDIQQASNPNPHANRLKPQNANSGPTAMLKKAENMIDECVTGPLTQRLVTALLEEQLIQNPNEFGAADSSNSSSENTHSSTNLMNFRSISMLRNCVGIEKRIKKELIEQGILDMSDFPNNDEDEIYIEIKRVVSELTTIAEYNSVALKRLHEAAAEEVKRLEIKRKLDIVDQEILETYKRCLQNKRKPLTVDEQQEIFRLTSEQKQLSEQLERVEASHTVYE